MVEWWSWWSCQIVESSNGGAVDSSNLRIVEWWSWLNCRIVKPSNRPMVEWWSYKVVESSNGGAGGVVESSIHRVVEFVSRGGGVVSASTSESIIHRFEYRRRHLVDA